MVAYCTLLYIHNGCLILSGMKNIILFVGYFVPPAEIYEEIRSYFGEQMKIAILYDKNNANRKVEACRKLVDFDFAVDISTDEPEKIIDEIGEQLYSVTTRGETFLELYARLLPTIGKYVNAPIAEAVHITMSKSKTRDALFKSYPDISMKYVEFSADCSVDEMVSSVQEKVAFPVIIKPTGLSTSMLVSRANSPDELHASLSAITDKLDAVYDLRHGRGEHKIVVEEFAEGDLYSVDAYIDGAGSATFCPFVKVTTGVKAGKSDYYGYFQVTPSGLSDTEIHEAQQVAQQLIEAVGLTSSSSHIELINTAKGWRVVEIGPRNGGYRSQLYRLSSGIAHNINDLLVHAEPEKIDLGKPYQYAAMAKLYADREGVITDIQGIEEAKQVPQVKVLVQNLGRNDKFLFARNGGISLIELILAGENEAELLAALHTVESLVQVRFEK